MKFSKKSVALAASVFLLSAGFAGEAMAANPNAQPWVHPDAVDAGLAQDTDLIDVAFVFPVQNPKALKAFVASTVDRNSANYHQFLTPAQFADQYGASTATLTAARQYLKSQGLTITQTFNNKLVIMARGTNAQFASLLGTTIHKFSTAAGVTFQRPTTPITLPAALQGVVLSVRGLSTEPRFRPHYMRAPTAITTGQSANAAHRANATPADGATPPTFHTPGTYTVQDLATRNNITPLYTAGYDGTGKTIGIMTFASYTATDATTYWSGIGINHTGSVTVVNVGGTIGTSGGGETALDVEQSGGIAPGANIIVYEAPNTSAGEIALYTRAVTDNIADTLSISWGEAEADYSPADLVALNQIFMQSAAQGVPISASSGDSGAYDINGEGYTYPNYTPTLSVDFPAASPYILAAGGTTLPGEQDFYNSAGTAIVGSVTIPQERPWGWDYLQTVAETKLGYSESLYYADLFPVGGGGGVSIQYSVPSYQAGLPGVRTSMPGQLLFCIKNSTTNTSTGLIGCTAGNAVTGEAPFTANFAGRNVPDVSLNADPDTGYVLYSVSDGGTGWTSGYGGTSFVAPELNGIFALISQKTGGRLGWVHPQMYTAFQNLGYGAGSPFRPITSATNLFWPATNSYNPATGLGTLDAANLAAIF